VTRFLARCAPLLRVLPPSYRQRWSTAFNRTGTQLLEAGRPIHALEPLATAIRLFPDNADAHVNLGYAFRCLGSHSKAVGHLRTGVQLAPEYARAHQLLGDMLVSLGELREGAHYLKRASELLDSLAANPTPEAARLRCLSDALHFALAGSRSDAIGRVTDFLLERSDCTWHAYKTMCTVLEALDDSVAYQHCAHGCMEYALGPDWCPVPEHKQVSLNECIRNNLARAHSVHPSEQLPIVVPPSRRLDDFDSQLFSGTEISSASPPRIAILKSATARITHFGTAVYAADGRYVPELSTGDTRALAASSPIGSPRRLPGPLLLAAEPWGNEFFHWMFDVLPKLGVFGTYDHLHICLKGKRKYQEEHLRMLGVSAERMVYIDEADAVSASEMIIVTGAKTPYDRYEIRPWVVNFLRSSLLPHASGRNDLPKRFFVLRREGNGRKIVNHDHFEQRLLLSGFSPVTLEELTAADQIRLFEAAEAIVAVAGAGLANLVFSSAAAKVLVIYPPSVQWQLYWRICGILGLRHYHCTGTSNSAFGRADPNWTDIHNNRDLEVDLNAVQRFLNEVAAMR
jgi:capsular polysaccharide biosynthesis protein